jgi:alpha-tubulin suppressor-like RCC1 family protein
MRKSILIVLVIPLFQLQLYSNGLPAGQVVGWGSNGSGEAVGVPASDLYSVGTVAIGGHDLTDVVAISAGLSHSLALKSNGTVVGWGNNMSGRAVGTESESPFRTNGLVEIGGQVLSNVVAIAACQYSLALKRDGRISVWGHDPSGRPIIMPSGLSNVTAIAAGWRGSLALKSDGTVVSWMQANVPSG